MNQNQRDAIDRAIRALTDEVEITDHATGAVTVGEAVPLLTRSVGNELRRIERSLAPVGIRGGTMLGILANCIDEALLALAEATNLDDPDHPIAQSARYGRR